MNFKGAISKKIVFLKNTEFQINLKEELGRGGFGTVYKGCVLQENKS
jgi:hypothetical protein